MSPSRRREDRNRGWAGRRWTDDRGTGSAVPDHIVRAEDGGNSPGDDRSLAFACWTLTVLDGEEQLATFDVGGGPEPLFAEGVYGAESTDDRTYRWFGGPEGVTRGAFPETDLEAATAVRLEGNPPPIDSQTVALSVNGTGTGTLEMTESPGTYDLSAVA